MVWGRPSAGVVRRLLAALSSEWRPTGRMHYGSRFCLKAAVADGYVCNPRGIVSAGNTLSIELLEAVRDRWQQDGAPTADALRPGLTDAEMDDLTAPLDLRLPPEARTLWGWHDGAELGLNVRWIGRGWEPLPL